MCHDNDSRPPAPPGSDNSGEGADIHLNSADGTQLMAYHARPKDPNGAAVVILPDIRGLHEFYKALARRFAETGINAVAIDYFARQLPDGPRQESHQAMFPLVGKLVPDEVVSDIKAAVDFVASEGGDASRSVFTVGFCYGGSFSWNQSALDARVAGAIGFYGRPDGSRPLMSQMKAPLLVLAAGADMMTTHEDNEQFDVDLSEAGVEHELIIYEGAPHAFFDGAGGYDNECTDAWQRVLSFIASHSGVAA
ncbi:MAG: dienelactone hydrolase family protein [Acidimicrobiales bacterium]